MSSVASSGGCSRWEWEASADLVVVGTGVAGLTAALDAAELGLGVIVIGGMRAQASEQGRYLGGRPQYGYRLVDAGPHPNRAHARWGRRLQRLDPDPVTSPYVQWMFAQRSAGRSVASIAGELTSEAG